MEPKLTVKFLRLILRKTNNGMPRQPAGRTAVLTVLLAEDHLEGEMDSWHVGAPPAARPYILASKDGLVLIPYFSEAGVCEKQTENVHAGANMRPV